MGEDRLPPPEWRFDVPPPEWNFGIPHLPLVLVYGCSSVRSSNYTGILVDNGSSTRMGTRQPPAQIIGN